MSLKSFLNNPDVRERFKAEFPKPSFKINLKLLAPPLTQNFSLVGTAFDYLLRFQIERLNPKAKTRKWIAESLADRLTEFDGRPVQKIVTTIRTIYDYYLLDGKVDDGLLTSVLCLAKLDEVFRTGPYGFETDLSDYDPPDKKDLRKLISLVPKAEFTCKKICSLNPTFGIGSKLVGGADGDLIIDDALIEIKTVQKFELTRDTLNQLVGYYILSKIGGIAGTPKSHQINKLGIYFSRHGYLWTFKVDEVINKEKLPAIITWFEKLAKTSKS